MPKYCFFDAFAPGKGVKYREREILSVIPIRLKGFKITCLNIVTLIQGGCGVTVSQKKIVPVLFGTPHREET